MTDDTPALTIYALTVIGHQLIPLSAEWGDLNLQGEEKIPAAALTELREMWGLLLGCDEIVAADWLAAQVNARGSGEPAERFDRFADGLGPLAAGTGHVTLVGYDEVAEVKEAGGWWALCETCGDHTLGFPPQDLELGYFPTEAEAKAVAARHVAEAGALRGV
jgi:hypothetical protein